MIKKASLSENDRCEDGKVLRLIGQEVSFQDQTIYPEVVERHHIFAHIVVALQSEFFKRRISYVPVQRSFRAEYGGVMGRGVLWV